MATLSEKLLHLANLENSYIALMKVGLDDSTVVHVGYKDEYGILDPANPCDYDDHYKTISLCLQRILLNLEVEDIEENQQQKQELKGWIERYPLSLGILNWDGVNEYDDVASEPFLLREIIIKRKFQLLPFFIEAGMDYFGAVLRGGLLQKLYDFEEIYEGDYFLEHELFPDDIVYPEMTVLDAIVTFDYDDSVALEVLSTLKDMDILQRDDIQKRNLLSKTFFFGGRRTQERFNFLVEMNPEALLKEVDEADIYAFDIVNGDGEFFDWFGDWTPALMIIFATYEEIDFEKVLQRYFQETWACFCFEQKTIVCIQLGRVEGCY